MGIVYRVNAAKRLLKYWAENVRHAREAHDWVIWAVSLLFGVLGLALKSAGAERLSIPIDSISLWIASACALVGVLWLPVRRHENLSERLTPRLSVACGRNVEGSKPSRGPYIDPRLPGKPGGPSGTEDGQWFRLVISGNGMGMIEGVRVQLMKIERAGSREPLWTGEVVDMTFAGGTAIKSDLPDLGRLGADILVVTESGWIFAGTLHRQWHFDQKLFHTMIGPPGDLFLTVLVSGKDTTSQSCRLHFHWTGKIEGSSLELI